MVRWILSLVYQGKVLILLSVQTGQTNISRKDNVFIKLQEPPVALCPSSSAFAYQSP